MHEHHLISKTLLIQIKIYLLRFHSQKSSKEFLERLSSKIILFAPDPETKNLQIYEPFRDYFLGSFDNLHFSGIFRQNINSKTVFFINVHEFMLIKASTIFVCE